MYEYTAFGLPIRSALPLPELTPWQPGEGAGPDLTIRYGTVPHHLDDGVWIKRICQVGAEGVLFPCPGIGHFLLERDDAIRVAPAPEAAARSVRFALLGSCLGAVLHRRGVLPLHASAVADAAGRAVLMAGDQGCGKSTTAALFARAGYRFLADDICAVVSGAGGPVVHPSFPRQKLSVPGLHRLGERAAGWPRIEDGRAKHVFTPSASFSTAPASAGAIVLLRKGAALHHRRLRPREALPELLRHTYRKSIATGTGHGAGYLQRCRDLACRIPIWVVERSAETPPEAVAERIEALFTQRAA